ncbi:MAG: hypothetical protein GWP91_12855 [Rhodobacterales bacterium]|nr:hypothetical protein [Rhodobacterales bacterium]
MTWAGEEAASLEADAVWVGADDARLAFTSRDQRVRELWLTVRLCQLSGALFWRLPLEVLAGDRLEVFLERPDGPPDGVDRGLVGLDVEMEAVNADGVVMGQAVAPKAALHWGPPQQIMLEDDAAMAPVCPDKVPPIAKAPVSAAP